MKRTTIFAINIVTIISSAVFCAGADGPQKPKPGENQATGLTAGTTDKSNSGLKFAERYPRYELRADDLLEITFEFTPEFNQTVTVQPDGFVSLRALKDVHVAGKTLPEVTQTVQQMYAMILQNPSISIVLKDFEKPYVVIGGQVGRPGKYELRGDMTVTEAIAVAGGFNNSAKHSQVVLYRRVSPDRYEAKLINVKKLMKSHDLTEDTHLKPGDTLFVPQNALSKIRQFVPNPGVGLGATF
jgi:polysaccharide export outer membrane protein